jgi:hypothetical protein
MDVVNKIKAVRTSSGANGMGDVPVTPVVIKSVRVDVAKPAAKPTTK